MTMADRLAVMSAGRIVQMGTPEEVYEAPRTRFAAEFIGSTNLFDGTLADAGTARVLCADLPLPLSLAQVPPGAAAGAPVGVSLRPERIALSYEPLAGEAANAARAIVEQIAYMGSYTVFRLRLDHPRGRTLAVSLGRAELNRLPRRPDYDDAVTLRWSPDALVVLQPGAEGGP